MLSYPPEVLVLAAVLIPFIGALLIPLFHRVPNLREAVTLATAGALFLTVLGLLGPVLAGARPEALNIEVVPGLALAFKVEPLGMLFALVASGLWIVTSIYSIGYMRGNDEPRQTSYYVCFAVALGCTIGIAFAKNLFTLFLFYEALTLSTYPLVAHKANAEAIRAGRIYLLLLLGTSLVLLLPAIVVTWALAGTIDFTPGGILEGKASGAVIGLLLALYAFGIGKAALMPLHFWLPAAMVAPTPVSALLHAVAVVKAGVFTIVKVVVYVFGTGVLARQRSCGLARIPGLGEPAARIARGFDARQSKGPPRLLDGQPARLCGARCLACQRHQHHRQRPAHCYACCRKDHAVFLRRRHLHGAAQDRDQRHDRHRTKDADHDDRLSDRLAQHNRPAAIRRYMEQVDAGAGRR